MLIVLFPKKNSHNESLSTSLENIQAKALPLFHFFLQEGHYTGSKNLGFRHQVNPNGGTPVTPALKVENALGVRGDERESF